MNASNPLRSHFILPWKNNLSTFKHMAIKVVINSKEKSATIAAEKSLFERQSLFSRDC